MDDFNSDYVLYQLKNNITDIEDLISNISKDNYESFLILFSKKIFTLKAITSFYEMVSFLNILINIEKINFKIKSSDYYEVWKILEVYKSLFKDIHDVIENEEELKNLHAEYEDFFLDPFIYSSERIVGNNIGPMLDSSVFVKKFDIFQVYLFYLEFDDFLNNSDDIKNIRKRWNEFRKVFSNISFENMIELKMRLKKIFVNNNIDISIRCIDKKVIIMKSVIEGFLDLLNNILKLISYNKITNKVNCIIQKDKRDFIEIEIRCDKVDNFLKTIFSKFEFSYQEFDNELLRLIQKSAYSSFFPDFIRIKKNIERSPFSVKFKMEDDKIRFYFREDSYVML